MSIRKVDEMPRKSMKVSKTQNIRDDIKEAINEGIECFVFEGYGDWCGLYNTVRSVARRIFHPLANSEREPWWDWYEVAKERGTNKVYMRIKDIEAIKKRIKEKEKINGTDG